MTETSFATRALPDLAEASPIKRDLAAAVANPLPGVAPFALLRVAALPLRMLEDLRLPKTEARVEALLLAERSLAALRQTVEDALFALVPRIAEDDGPRRRSVLGLRRDVHNERPTRLDASALGMVRDLLEHDPDRIAFDTWVAAQQAHAEA